MNGKDYMEKSLVRNCKLRAGATLKHPATLKVELELELCSCPEFDQHMVTFTFADATSKVSQGEKMLGEVSAGVGGVLFLRDKATEYNYLLDPRKVWAAFQQALANDGSNEGKENKT